MRESKEMEIVKQKESDTMVHQRKRGKICQILKQKKHLYCKEEKEREGNCAWRRREVGVG